MPRRAHDAACRIAAVCGALASVLAFIGEARAERRDAAKFSYCGLGHAEAHSSVQPGGGGDTVQIGGDGDAYVFIYDSASPLTLDDHDRLIIENAVPSALEFKRVGDHLAICNPTSGGEVVIERHYCRSARLAETDVANNEIEEIAFLAAGEIWIADVLYAEYLKDRSAFPRHVARYYGPGRPQDGWRVRPFSEVLPDWVRPADTCGAD
ncbi:MAG TPA: hypothetical protein PK264_08685 [Hyphomicrobiaceae bacterium]|nr:hypothetical protein [Hyphomicrobiaceae bacterium]